MRRLTQFVTIALAAFAIGLAYRFGDALRHHELVLAPLAALCLIAAFWCGLRNSRAVAPTKRLWPAISFTIAVGVLLVLPAGPRWLWLQHEVRAIPITSDAYNIERETELFSEFRRMYSVRYMTRGSFESTEQFLIRSFKEKEWKIAPSMPVHDYTPADFAVGEMAFTLRRSPAGGAVRNYTVLLPNRFLDISLFDAGTERWVICRAYSDELPE